MKWISIPLWLYFSTALANCLPDIPAEGMVTCEYNKFTVLLSCKDRLAVLSILHRLEADTGSENTSSRSYFLDERANIQECQQSSDDRYAKTNKGYDVGHLTAIDHLDDNQVNALQTNVMTNMIPQASKFNRNGAWKRTESLVECYREKDGPNNYPPLTVYSGILFGNDISNDHFIDSHGITRTPDFLWKLVYSHGTNQYDAWLMQNKDSSKVSTITQSRRSIDALIKTLSIQSKLDSTVYLPVINILKELSNKSPKRIKMVFHSRCNIRKG